MINLLGLKSLLIISQTFLHLYLLQLKRIGELSIKMKFKMATSYLFRSQQKIQKGHSYTPITIDVL